METKQQHTTMSRAMPNQIVLPADYNKLLAQRDELLAACKTWEEFVRDFGNRFPTEDPTWKRFYQAADQHRAAIARCLKEG